MKKRTILLVLLVATSLTLAACKGNQQQTDGKHQMKVVTTLFPLYEFASKVGGEKVHAVLLLPPGTEPHDFEPKPRDIATIQDADVFIYTGNAMEPWAQTILKGIDSKSLVVVDASRGIALRSAETADHEGEGHDPKGHGSRTNSDPHIWLDFDNVQTMVKNIADGFSKRVPEHSDLFRRNASAYSDRIRQLSDEYRSGLAQCKTRFFLYGGHYAFNYLARRYNLNYISVHGVSPNSEPSPAHLVDMVNKMKQQHLGYIFHEELASPRTAETIARETGATLLPLNPAHNVTKEQMQQHTAFVDIMETNLAMLRRGLQCR